MSLTTIPFSRPYRARNELANLGAVLESGHVHGDGTFTRSVNQRLKDITGAAHSLLTSSCTHALDMASILLDLHDGDEVILPSFTFSSAATSIALSHATPVFIDIDPSSGNINPDLIAPAVTPKTKAISIVHYGGVAADVDSILAVAAEFELPLIEDNAHGLGGKWRGRSLGTLGTFGTQSFHDTKNVHSGEGGALLINDSSFVERAEIIREKGTDRSRFLRGQVDKYTWTDVGSSYLMSELNAAVLDAQLEEFDTIQGLRHGIWNRYAIELAEWSETNGATLMSPSAESEHTAHLFYLLMQNHEEQIRLLAHLRSLAVIGTFHYIPLDSSPAGLRLGRTPYECVNAHDFSSRLVRLPLWAGMTESDVTRVIDGVTSLTSPVRAG